MAGIDKANKEEMEQFHSDAESRMKIFKYERPESSRVKDVVMLARTKRIMGLVQVVKDGGENNLHYHTNSDTIWMVLRGAARFYTVNDKPIGEFGAGEGILIPGGARYWFEKTGETDLELLQFVGYGDHSINDERINVDKHKDWMEGVTEVNLMKY